MMEEPVKEKKYVLRWHAMTQHGHGDPKPEVGRYEIKLTEDDVINGKFDEEAISEASIMWPKIMGASTRFNCVFESLSEERLLDWKPE